MSALSAVDLGAIDLHAVDLEFLRPLWLLGLLAIPPLLWWLRRHRAGIGPVLATATGEGENLVNFAHGMFQK